MSTVFGKSHLVVFLLSISIAFEIVGFLLSFTVFLPSFRSQLPNVSPETGIRDKAVPFKVMMKHRIGVDPLAKLKPCMGVNAAPKGSGVYRVGDWVDVRRFVGDDI